MTSIKPRDYNAILNEVKDHSKGGQHYDDQYKIQDGDTPLNLIKAFSQQYHMDPLLAAFTVGSYFPQGTNLNDTLTAAGNSQAIDLAADWKVWHNAVPDVNAKSGDVQTLDNWTTNGVPNA